MKRTLLIALREYLENVKTKGFWLGILMMPLTLVLVGVMPQLVESAREAKTYAVIDHAGIMPDVREMILKDDFVWFLAKYDDEQLANSDMPTQIAQFLPELRALDDSERSVIAYFILENADHDLSLSRRLSALLDTNRAAFNSWWRDLSPSEKAVFSPGISTNHFVESMVTAAVATQETEKRLNQRVEDGELFAYFILEDDLFQISDHARYASNNLTDQSLENWLGGKVSRHIRNQRLKSSNLDDKTAAWISETVTFESVTVGADGTQEVSTDDIARQWAPLAFVFFLWMSILINTQLLLTNTIEEKSNKVIEVLLSSVSAIELMSGKILGIAATGLTIIASWATIFLLFFVALPSLVDTRLPIDPTAIFGDITTLSLFLMYFVLGYLLYAALLVGLGSLCNNLKDAQNLIMPVQMIQIIPMLLLVPIIQDPNGSLAVTLSYIPPLTPFVMMNRTAGPPTDFEYASTTALLVVSIVIAFWFAAKLFRAGILMTGKPPGVREIWRMLRSPVTPMNSKSQTPIN